MVNKVGFRQILVAPRLTKYTRFLQLCQILIR